MKESSLDLRLIHDPRHPGVSPALCEALTEAAEVCLGRHHSAPSTDLHVTCCGDASTSALSWRSPTAAAQRAWNNRDDATRDGAYVVALAVVESVLGLVAIARAETRTGADYYLASAPPPDLESATRLEVSGVDSGSLSYLRRRLREKLDQAARGDSDLPALAAVVGFQMAVVLIDEIVTQ